MSHYIEIDLGEEGQPSKGFWEVKKYYDSLNKKQQRQWREAMGDFGRHFLRLLAQENKKK